MIDCTTTTTPNFNTRTGHCWAPHFGSLGDSTKYQQQYLKHPLGHQRHRTKRFVASEDCQRRSKGSNSGKSNNARGKHATKRLIAADSTASLQHSNMHVSTVNRVA
eukprot:gene17425-30879_t